MPSFQNLPPELRQQILFYLFPSKTKDPKHPPKELRQLMDVSPQFERDVKKVARIWSPEYLITSPTALQAPFGKPKIHNVKLSLFHDYTTAELHVKPKRFWGKFTMRWLDAIPKYARCQVQKITIDATPAPGCMRIGESSSRWLAMFLNDNRTRLYQRDHCPRFVQFIERLIQKYGGNQGFELKLTGHFGDNSTNDMKNLCALFRQQSVRITPQLVVLRRESNSIPVTLQMVSDLVVDKRQRTIGENLMKLAWQQRTLDLFALSASYDALATYELLGNFVDCLNNISVMFSGPSCHYHFGAYSQLRRALVHAIAHDIGFTARDITYPGRSGTVSLVCITIPTDSVIDRNKVLSIAQLDNCSSLIDEVEQILKAEEDRKYSMPGAFPTD